MAMWLERCIICLPEVRGDVAVSGVVLTFVHFAVFLHARVARFLQGFLLTMCDVLTDEWVNPCLSWMVFAKLSTFAFDSKGQCWLRQTADGALDRMLAMHFSQHNV